MEPLVCTPPPPISYGMCNCFSIRRKYPTVKGTLFTRIGVRLRFILSRLLRSTLWTRMGIVQFIIKHTLSHSFPHPYASTPAWKHQQDERNSDHVCLIRNCTVPMPILSALFNKRTNFCPRPMRFHRVPFTAG